MNVVSSLLAVIVLVAVGLLAGQVGGLRGVFGTYIPYAAIAVFLGGISWRVIRWAKSPVPFRIPTTTGQQKSLDWIKSSVRSRAPASSPKARPILVK